jgi:hypothetical protein
MPGEYTVVLTAAGKSYTQPLAVKMDPRVKTPLSDLARQFELSKRLYDEWLKLEPLVDRINAFGVELTNLRARVGEGTVATQIDALNKKVQELTGTASRRPGTPPNLVVLARLQTLFNVIQEVDVAPTAQVAAAVADVQRESNSLLERWRAIESQDIPALNKELQGAGIPKLEAKERGIRWAHPGSRLFG